jgi:hypothetical protein
LPDQFGFEHLGGNGRPRLRCIVCGATGDPWEWPAARREQHHRAHQGDAEGQTAEAELEQARTELRKASTGRRDRRIVHPPRVCANPFCAKVFHPRRLTARYCSRRCRVAAHRGKGGA